MNGVRRPRSSSPITDPTSPFHLRPHGKHIARAATLLVSFLLMTLALGGAGQFLLRVFDEGIDKVGWSGLAIQLILYGVILAFALGVSLLGMRNDVGNVVITAVFEVYKFAMSGAIVFLYYQVILRLFRQMYRLPNFLLYVGFLLAGVLLLFVFNGFSETKKLRWHGGAILTMCLMHLLVMVGLYGLEQNTQVDYFFADLIVLMLMVVSGVTMLIGRPRPANGSIHPQPVWRGNAHPPGSA